MRGTARKVANRLMKQLSTTAAANSVTARSS
jgi:hypothetical protein